MPTFGDRPGRVEAIHITPGAGQPMAALERVRAIAGTGLEGDRYAAGTGHWSAIRRSGDSLTLIEAEEIERIAAALGLELAPGATRRNVTTRGVRLPDLIGRRFHIGEVECQAVRYCEPCSYLDGLLGQDLLAAFVHRAGIRAEIVTDGTIAIGDAVHPAVAS